MGKLISWCRNPETLLIVFGVATAVRCMGAEAFDFAEEQDGREESCYCVWLCHFWRR